MEKSPFKSKKEMNMYFKLRDLGLSPKKTEEIIHNKKSEKFTPW